MRLVRTLRRCMMAISLLMLANRRGQHAAAPMLATSAGGATGGYRPGGAHKSVSAAMAFLIAGGVGAGLVAALIVPELLAKLNKQYSVLWVTQVVPPPPPPDVDDAPPSAEQVVTVTPRPQPNLNNDNQVIVPDFIPPELPSGPMTGTDGGLGDGGTVIADPPRPTPVFRQARRDQRRLADFQPEYPAAARREEREGACSVSVTIRTDGRVSAVRAVDCPDPDFYRATERRALSRWRFEPATRDGVAVEGTRTETVRFEIEDTLR
jgi:periplasmic protein TonB